MPARFRIRPKFLHGHGALSLHPGAIEGGQGATACAVTCVEALNSSVLTGQY